MKVFTAQQMREFDRAATEEYGIPSIVLMENAALRVVEFLEMKFAPLHEKKIVVLCGKGNNGGDGFAIARHLSQHNTQIDVLVAAGQHEIKGDALVNHKPLEIEHNSTRFGTKIIPIRLADIPYHLEEYDLVIDALLGTGFKGEIHGDAQKAATRLNASDIPTIAVDIPSGLDSSSGEAAYEAIRAHYTITFAGPKRGMFCRDAFLHCGEIWVGSIGTLPAQMKMTHTGCECITRKIAHELLPTRLIDAHKGDAGRVLLIGGSTGMSGAPTLAAKAVLKSGAGLCIAALPEPILPSFAAAFPEATSHPLSCSSQGSLTEQAADQLPALWENVQVVAIGPGISRDPKTLTLVQNVVRECPQPLVIDADALYALREIENDVKNRTVPTILTPHPGEMGELMGIKTKEVQENRIETAIACAQRYNAIVLLKGARSIIALPDGNTYINLTGNSGMASGGSGDVLTGTIAGLLAQLKKPANAARLGVYLHGFAGDLAFAEKGNGLIAGDIAENLPRALLELSKPLEPPVNARLWKLE